MNRSACARLIVVTVLVASRAFAAGPVVVVDPGHGGNKDGASSADGFLEKDLALSVSKRVRAQLRARLGAKVIITRERDESVGLPERVQLANRSRPDVFISIHANSMPTRRLRERTHGMETFFLSASASGEDARKTAARENAEAPISAQTPEDDTLAFILADLQRSEAHAESSRLAYAVHQKLIGATGAHDRGVHQAPFYVLMGVIAPAILIEVGYISHPEEGRRLRDEGYQELIATAIVDGVEAFLRESAVRDKYSGPIARP